VATRIAIPATCLLLCLAGCASGPQRPAVSTVGCAQAVVAALPPAFGGAFLTVHFQFTFVGR